jgi:hypothetical protein
MLDFKSKSIRSNAALVWLLDWIRLPEALVSPAKWENIDARIITSTARIVHDTSSSKIVNAACSFEGGRHGAFMMGLSTLLVGCIAKCGPGYIRGFKTTLSR